MTLFGGPTFNYLIMVLYVINAFWWLWHGSRTDFFYWIFADGITATVTFGYRHCS